MLDYDTKEPIGISSVFIIFLFPLKDVTISYHYRLQWRINNSLMPSWELFDISSFLICRPAAAFYIWEQDLYDFPHNVLPHLPMLLIYHDSNNVC